MLALVMTLALTTTQVDEVAPAAPEQSWRDTWDLGAGLTVGLTSGLKLRVGKDLGDLYLGADVDAGTVLLIWTATGHAVVGWSFRPGSFVLRPYVRCGVGTAVVLPPGSSSGAGVLPIIPIDAGLEWKITSWFGLGIEGGAAIAVADTWWSAYPQGKLTAMFYL
jgi:hypothetical protein